MRAQASPPRQALAALALAVLAVAPLPLAGAARAEESWNVSLISQALFSSAFRTFVEGERLYVGCGASLLVYDISNPLAPTRLGFFRTEGEIYGLHVRHARAYLAAMSEGVRIVDCSDPAAPRELGSIPNAPGGLAYSVDVVRDTAYVADGDAGLLVADCRDPQQPEIRAAFDPYPAGILMMDVSVLGTIAYGAFLNVNPLLWSALTLIDCRDLDHPAVIDQAGTGSLGSYALFVTPDSTAYVANGRGVMGNPYPLLVFDCTDPARIRLAGRYSSPNPSALGCDVQVAGDLVYLASGYLSDMHRGGDTWYPNVQIFDRRDLALDMTPVGQTRTDNFSLGIAVAPGVAYVADEWAGVQVVSVADPRAPEIIARLDTGGYPLDVALLGSRAYVAAEGGKLRIVDFSDALAPIEREPFPVEGVAEAVAVAAGRAFTAEGFDFVQGLPGLTAVDVSAESPALLGRFEAPADTTYLLDLEVRGDRAYVANGIGGLRILDLQSLPSISELSKSAVPGKCSGIAVDDTVAYLAAETGGLRMWSVADPRAPHELGAWAGSDSVFAVAARNQVAYAACGAGGLAIVDCRDPGAPREVGSCPTADVARAVALGDDRAYVADARGGLRIIDISSLVAPREVGFFDTPYLAAGVAARGDTVFVADMRGGLYLLRDLTQIGIAEAGPAPPATGPRIVRGYPNPFRTETRFQLVPSGWPADGSDGGRARLGIYDAGGRRIRSLTLEPGEETVWDGRDDHGRATAAGVYYLRATFPPGAGTISGRAVLLE